LAWLGRFLAGFSMVPVVEVFSHCRDTGALPTRADMCYWVEVDFSEVILDEETYDAVLFRIGDAEVWLPRSQMRDEDYDICSKSGSGTVEISRWLAEKRDLV
jgi:hypothetical protein